MEKRQSHRLPVHLCRAVEVIRNDDRMVPPLWFRVELVPALFIVRPVCRLRTFCT